MLSTTAAANPVPSEIPAGGHLLVLNDTTGDLVEESVLFDETFGPMKR